MRLLGTLVSVMLAASMLIGSSMPAQAKDRVYRNGKQICRYNDESIFLYGDSRVGGMMKTNPDFGGSVVYGGHFRQEYNDKNATFKLPFEDGTTKYKYAYYIFGRFKSNNGKYNGYGTKYKDSYSYIKAQAKSAIKKNGYCHIWLFCTTNDANKNYKNNINDVLDFAKKAQGWNAKYNGKTKYVKVHVVHIVPDKYGKKISKAYLKGFNGYVDKQVDKFNKTIKKGYPICKNDYNNIVKDKSIYTIEYRKTHPNADIGYGMKNGEEDVLHYTKDTYLVIGNWIRVKSKKY